MSKASRNDIYYRITSLHEYQLLAKLAHEPSKHSQRILFPSEAISKLVQFCPAHISNVRRLLLEEENCSTLS